MRRQTKRWPIWKITATGASCVVAAGVLFWLSGYLDRLGIAKAAEHDPNTLLTLPGFVLILGMAVSMFAVVCFIWLSLRIKEARTPPWERKGKSKRR